MTLEEGLYSYLSTYAGLTALVNLKIHPLMKPQDTELPAVVYTKLSNDRLRSPVGGNWGMQNVTYQLAAYADTFAEAIAIREQLHAALLNYTGLMGTVTVQGCFSVGEVEGYNDVVQEYFANVDYQITINQ